MKPTSKRALCATTTAPQELQERGQHGLDRRRLHKKLIGDAGQEANEGGNRLPRVDQRLESTHDLAHADLACTDLGHGVGGGGAARGLDVEHAESHVRQGRAKLVEGALTGHLGHHSEHTFDMATTRKVGGSMVQEMTSGAHEAAAEQRVQDLEQTLVSLREDSEIAHVLLGLAGLLAEVRTVEETLETAVRVVPELMGADRCFAATRLGAGRQFSILAYDGYDEEGLRVLRATTDEDGFPLLSGALAERIPLMIPDAVADPRVPAATAQVRNLGAYIGIPLVRWGEEFGGIALEYTEAREFKPKDLALARGIARQVGVALVNARRFNLLGDLRSFGLRAAPKLRLSQVIEEVSRRRRAVVGRCCRRLLLRFEPARAGGPARQRRARSGGQTAADRSERRTLERSRPGTSRRGTRGPARRTGRATVDHRRRPVPGDRGSVVGAVLVFFKRAVTLAPDEAEALSVLAGQASMSIDNAKRYERQRRVAHSLQEGLLLSELSDLECCDLAAVYDPASGQADIGGDFYDVFDLPDGRYAIVVGDVSGKGAESAALTAMAKYMLRAFAIRNPAPSSVLFHLNNALLHDFEDERFVTLLYGLLDPTDHSCSFGLAGHPPPLIYRQGGKNVETVELQGSILGVFPDEQFQQETYGFERDDVFVAFTDGLLEARSGKEFYGRRRIEQGLSKHAPGSVASALTQRLLQDAKDFGSISDDTVVFALRFRAA